MSAVPKTEALPPNDKADASIVNARAIFVGGLRRLPHLLIAGSFTGSAVLMKLLPYFGYAIPDKAFKKAVVKSYKAFVAVPPLNAVLQPLQINHKKFMLILGILHLIAVALLVLPKRRWTAHAVGLYVMAVMIGAEYCTRRTGFVPPGTPPEWVYEAQLFGTFTHVLLMVCGALLNFPLGVFSADSLGLWPAFTGLFHVSTPKDSASSAAPAQGAQPQISTQVATPAGPAVAKVESATAKVAGVSATSVGSKKRDSTPPPKAASAPQRQAPAVSTACTPTGPKFRSAAARGSAALNS